MRPIFTIATLALLAWGSGALAQDHAGMAGMHAGRTAGASASTRGYEDAMARMHQAMAITYTGDADHDFAAGMLPHHQGAVDMARVELKFGKDPEMRRLAQDVVSSQEKEIAFMRAWLAKHRK